MRPSSSFAVKGKRKSGDTIYESRCKECRNKYFKKKYSAKKKLSKKMLINSKYIFDFKTADYNSSNSLEILSEFIIKMPL
jgi:hypothetical protein